jgi:hypothetical protein
MSDTPVSLNSTATLKGAPLRMCRLSFDPPLRMCKHREQAQSSFFDHFLRGMHIRVLQQTHVLLIQTTDEHDGSSYGAPRVLECRTDAHGYLVLADSGYAVPLSENQKYSYYWTANTGCFRRVMQDVVGALQNAEALCAVLATHGFSRFALYREPYWYEGGKTTELELLARRDDRDPLSWLLNLALFSSAASPRGYCDAWELYNYPAVSGLEREGNYLFARRRVADAVYCAELIHNHALTLRQRSAEQYSLFSAVRDMQHKVHEGAFDFPNSDSQAYRDQYMLYAYLCATHPDDELSHELYKQAVNVDVTDNSWISAAQTIHTNFGIPHPSFDHKSGTSRHRFIALGSALAYFHFYRFSLSEETAAVLEEAEHQESEIAGQVREVQSKLESFLSQISYCDVLACLAAAQEPNGRDHRIHIRFLDICAAAHCPWYESFSLKDETAWERLKPYVESLAEFGDKFFELYKEHFGNYDTIVQYNEMLQTKGRKLESLILHTNKLNKLLGGKTVAIQDGTFQLTIQPDATGTMLTVTETADDAAEREITKLAFGMELGPGEPIEVPNRMRSGRLRRRARSRTKLVRPGTAPVLQPVQGGYAYIPAWLNVLAHAILLAQSLVELRDAMRSDGAGDELKMLIKVGKDAFQFVNSGTETLHATLSNAFGEEVLGGLAEFGEKLEPAGLVLEAVLNIQEGAEILQRPESELIESIIHNGDPIEIALKRTKGLALLISPAPGFAAGALSVTSAGSLAAFAAATLPWLGIGLAAGVMVAATIDLACYLRHPETGLARALDDELTKAKREELETHRTLVSMNRFNAVADRLLSPAYYVKDGEPLLWAP